LSAFYWLPAVAEQPAVQLQENLTGYFDYRGHFRDDDQVQTTLQFNYDPAGRAPRLRRSDPGRMALAGGLVLILRWARERRIDPEPALALLITWARPCLSHHVRSSLEHMGLLRYVQFPWRFSQFKRLAQAAGGALVSQREGALVDTRQTVVRWLSR